MERAKGQSVVDFTNWDKIKALQKSMLGNDFLKRYPMANNQIKVIRSSVSLPWRDNRQNSLVSRSHQQLNTNKVKGTIVKSQNVRKSIALKKTGSQITSKPNLVIKGNESDGFSWDGSLKGWNNKSPQYMAAVNQDLEELKLPKI